MLILLFINLEVGTNASNSAILLGSTDDVLQGQQSTVPP